MRPLRCGLPAGSEAAFPQVDAGVAQLVEQRFRKPQVVGSSPTSGSWNMRRSDTRSGVLARGSSEGLTPT